MLILVSSCKGRCETTMVLRSVKDLKRKKDVHLWHHHQRARGDLSALSGETYCVIPRDPARHCGGSLAILADLISKKTLTATLKLGYLQ